MGLDCEGLLFRSQKQNSQKSDKQIIHKVIKETCLLFLIVTLILVIFVNCTRETPWNALF